MDIENFYTTLSIPYNEIKWQEVIHQKMLIKEWKDKRLLGLNNQFTNDISGIRIRSNNDIVVHDLPSVNWGVFTIFLTRIESRDLSISAYTAYLTIFQNSIREFD